MRKLITYAALMSATLFSHGANELDSIPAWFGSPLEWRISTELSPSFVPGTNNFLRGENDEQKRINSGISYDLRAGFEFSPYTKEGMLYKGLYQGIGVGVNSFFANSLLGTPVSAYVYQGSPIAHLSNRLCLGYEWQFGAAFGWKRYDETSAPDNASISTSATAMLGLGLKLHYSISERWMAAIGIGVTHYSNGNTSWPNGGVNTIAASVGITYIISPQKNMGDAPEALAAEADRGKWLYDITAYGAWRKRVVDAGDEPQLCPGKFGIAGLQFSPLRRLNRWVAIGPALDMQWDEGAGIDQYWIEGTSGSYIKFERPPFSKQISVGISAHAELTMPIFSVNAGVGYAMINPKGDKRFYQSLTLKTFISSKLFINVGYRLGDFKDPQNLMLGFGVRL